MFHLVGPGISTIFRYIMAVGVVEFSREGYKIIKDFA